MKLNLIDLIWTTVVIAFIVVRFIDQAATKERELYLERLTLKIDRDVHDHLKELSQRTVALEGWSTSVDKRYDEDVRRDLSVDQTLSELITDKIRREQDAGKTKR